MIVLQRIIFYPVKSLPGVEVDSAELMPGAGLRHDRQFALVDEQGQVVNGKRDARVHFLECRVDFQERTIRIGDRRSGSEAEFHVDDQRSELNDWLSRFFEQPVHVQESGTGGFPDDIEASGPTVITTATLTEVATWFSGLTLEACRRRFRANLEIGGTEPFWEDRLYGAEGQRVRFAIGEAMLEGVNPCRRCAVPSRDPDTGEPVRGFQKAFAEHRRATLPEWADRSRFNHFYRLAVNTIVPGDQPAATLHVGDAVRLV